MRSARWRVLALYSAWSGLMQFEWLRFAPITDVVAAQYGISANDVGDTLSGIFPFLFLLLALPCGWLIDRRNTRFSLVVTAVLMTLGAALRVAAPTYTALLVGQTVLAIAQPLVMGLVSKLVMVWFEEDERLLATGLGTLSIFVGLALAFVLVPLLAPVPVYSGLLLDAGVLAVLALLTVLGVPSDPAIAAPNASAATPVAPEISWWRGTLVLLRTPPFAPILAVIFLANGYSNAVFTWLEPMLKPQGISASQAGLAGLMILIGGIAGMSLLPRLPRVEERLRPLMITVAILGLGLTVILLRAQNFVVVATASVLVGVALLSLLPVFVDVVGRLGGPHLAGTAVSTFWLAGNAGSLAAIWSVSFAAGEDRWDRALYVLLGLLAIELLVTVLFFRMPKALAAEAK